ncbi:hypothetical protein L3V59_10860 [Burkholderia aenigmatica]|uniref:Uncharacterized protein n=1 Tax=Burkholderia aenigmatica TaxID=2015348 RepID=A0ABY6Y194_9BURK|nr:hypothetical protein [Burkholderia aenigmatica]UKD10210.1 hypothetical protein L3V59_10860 [Burkholderia aenigmatica]VWD19105.1 hypothetical protein BLA17378_06470 [Burkholderia aenigmatica]VWD46695.1 hypothetical protein BLA18628_05732 [Burkholderia aenigmatica]
MTRCICAAKSRFGTGDGEVGGNLASGIVAVAFYLPTKQGMKLWIPVPIEHKGGGLTPNSTPESEFGFFHLNLKCVAEASRGGSLLAEAGLEFEHGRNDVQQIKGRPRRPTLRRCCNRRWA